eukprot:TRINITY_DN23553_c0_g1_i1.p2 TRINITY_DN23553_c0_g1~~TRINITY_DN23553_c0_g1_i1.p2  ORF type:complete len:103 (-),score=1.62 TRINITY_DN23553_c0_g1_i1:214-522(-)
MFAEPLTRSRAERQVRMGFWAGFALLPWLWFANTACFWHVRTRSPIVRRYVHASAVAFIVSCVAAIVYWAILHSTVAKDSRFMVLNTPQLKEILQQLILGVA